MSKRLVASVYQDVILPDSTTY